MTKTEFKAESKRLLDLMIHSIYTHKEIFLREIISNASDATDKRYYNNLGTIAKSGSLDFKLHQEKNEDIDIIGQFGVGFYSAFMVSKQVKVITRSENAEQGYIWESDGADGYTVTPCEKDTIGTEIIMTLKDYSLPQVEEL